MSTRTSCLHRHPGSEEWGRFMTKKRILGCLATLVAGMFLLAGCSHAVFPQSGSSGSTSSSAVILTIHDSAPIGIAVPSFEVTITGAVLEPGNVSLLTNGQTVELTQLQTNSVYLSTTTSVPAGTYNSLQLTYSSPQFTIVNQTGAPQTTPSGQCPAGATCIISSPTTDKLSNNVSFTNPVVIGSSTPTLLEFDVNLNDVIQSDLSVDFSQSGGVTVTQPTGSSVSTIDTIYLAGQVQSVDSSANQFQLAASTGQTFTITTTASTIYEFGRNQVCMANDFGCITQNETVDVAVNIQSDGATFDAAEVDYDNAPNTVQVSGTIVGETGSPATSLAIVVHQTIPSQSSLPPGTPAIVNFSSPSYVINNGSFVLPSGVTFGSATDLMIGQEVEATLASGTQISGTTFSTNRLALEQAQLQAAVLDIESEAQPYPYFDINQLPALLTNEAVEIQVLDTSSLQAAPVQYQNLTPANISSLQTQEAITVGGFLFNSAPSPTIVATVVRAPQNP